MEVVVMKFKFKIEEMKEYKDAYKIKKKPPKIKEILDLDDFIFKDELIKYHSEK